VPYGVVNTLKKIIRRRVKMATRGSYGVYDHTKKRFVLGFSSSDSYPTSLGQEVLDFYQSIKAKPYQIRKLKSNAANSVLKRPEKMTDEEWSFCNNFLKNLLSGKVKAHCSFSPKEGGIFHEWCWCLDFYGKFLRVYMMGREYEVHIPFKKLPKEFPPIYDYEDFVKYAESL
jgi:hypothetical protein